MGEPLIIMLVEDNKDHVELIKRSMEDSRVANKIYEINDGEAALDYLFRKGEFSDPKKSPRPHVVLLDLRLPKVDGLEVLQKIKLSEELRHIPVVILTTSANERDMIKAYDNYANSYLVKPVDFHKFTQLMEDLGFYWLAYNKKPNI